MINKIIDGISVAIGSEFGEPCEIYTESIEQGFTEPCFSILCLNPTIEQFLGERYFRTNQFCIHYFPSSGEKRSECLSVMEKLMTTLETIIVGGDLIRGTKMNGEIVDGVLNFFVNYDMFVYKKKEISETPMDDFVHNTGLKG